MHSDAERGGTLPPTPDPRGAYRPATAAGGLVWSAGMTPRRGGHLVQRGRVGRDIDVRAAREAAALAAENALAAVAEVLGGLEQVERVVHLSVSVAATEEFDDHSAVADGASQAVARLLPRAAAPSRVAIGVISLPGGAAVEVQLIAASRPRTRSPRSER